MPAGLETLLHQIASGLANGAIYAVLALALVIVYRATHHINFVQGELAVFSTFVVWSCCRPGCLIGQHWPRASWSPSSSPR
jgi:branched-chain amino acid transport system permease protein